MTQPQAYLVAALVGAIAAIVVMILRDVIIEDRREQRRRRWALIEKRLSEIYSPLWVTFGGEDGTLNNVLGNEGMRTRIGAHFHLLSAELQDVMARSLMIGRFEAGNFMVGISDMERLIELTPSFKATLLRDIAKLQKELPGF